MVEMIFIADMGQQMMTIDVARKKKTYTKHDCLKIRSSLHIKGNLIFFLVFLRPFSLLYPCHLG